jgi:Na+-translocating ferredoxin:NAD+ oxidoreductase RnfG subunit
MDVMVIKGAEYFTNEKKISPLLDKIKVSKPPITLKEIQTVTGATVTQDAIVSAVNSAFENLKKGVNLNGIK